MRRRRVLSALSDAPGAVAERELAEELVGVEGETPAADADGDVRAARVDLRHVHLPKLADAGLVAWDSDDETVATTDHSAFGDEWFGDVLALDSERWDDAIDAITCERRRTVLAALASRDGASTLRDLACDVAVRETDGKPQVAAIDEVAARLHHVHLPKLAAAELISYDADDGSVTASGIPQADDGSNATVSRAEPPRRLFAELSSVVG